MERHDLLANMRAGREQLDAALARNEPAHLIEPILEAGWSIKDVLAHIGWWEQRIVATYHTLLHNDIPTALPERKGSPVLIGLVEIPINTTSTICLRSVQSLMKTAKDIKVPH